MTRLLLVLALLAAQQPPAEDPRLPALFERLLDDDIDAREKAAAEIVDIGKSALPALERLRDASDPELRARSKSLAKAIAEAEVVGRHWRRGARATIDVERVPVSKVLEDLAKKHGDSFKFEAADFQDPVTLRLRDATLWDSLEALSRATPALTWSVEGDALEILRRRRPPYPSLRSGEFLVWIDGITFTREQDFTGNARSAFSIGVSSSWERGVLPVAVDQRITEVIDESGVSLYFPERMGFAPRLDTPSGRLRHDEIRAPLAPGIEGVRRIKRIRGQALFLFPKAYEELVFDVRSPMPPRTFEGAVVTVRNFRPQKDGCAFEVIVTATQTGGDPLFDRLPFREVSVIDDKGEAQRPTSSSRSHSYGGTSFTIHENLQVALPEGRTAATLRLRVLKETLEKRVPFEFADISVE